MSPRTSAFDYIVVGAGTAGCVVASRLASHAPTLLLEAGGPDSGVRNGTDVGTLVATPDQLILSWSSPITKLFTTDKSPGIANRGITIHRGVVRGGSHSINGMIYVRGSRHDYDTWAQLGNDGWSFADVLPLFKASETFDPRPLSYDTRDLSYHGRRGALHVRPLPNPTRVAQAFVEACREVGYARSRPQWDFNGHEQDGAAGLYQVTVTPDGRRSSTARAFLDGAPAGAAPTVVMDATVTRVVFEKTRAVGVECVRNGSRQTYRATREVVLCAGAFGSPQLLMLSGIGPADALRKLGIRPIVDVPGVGENLHDHLMILVYHPAGGDPGQSSYIAEAGLFVNTRDRSGAASPDLQFHVLGRMPALSAAHEQALKLPARYFVVCPTVCKPQSRGVLRLRSARANDAPLLRPGYLDREADVDVLVRGLELGRDLVHTRALADFCDPAAAPFAVDGAARHRVVPTDAAEMREFVRNTATTVWHPAGTCKMGRDALAVVDPELRVYGVEGLRVADASIMPMAPSGNINAATIMIAEKCADAVLGRTHRHDGGDTRSAVNAKSDPLEALTEDLRRLLGEATQRPAAAHAAPTISGNDVVTLLGRMALAYTTTGLAAWARMADVCAKALPIIVRSVGSTTAGVRGDRAGEAADALKTVVRELLAVPGGEARRLQSELEAIIAAAQSRGPDSSASGAPVAPATDTENDVHWRRWRTKP